MPKNGANISLSSFDDIFSTDESRNVEKIQQISISELHHFKDHPFKVLDDDQAVIQMVDSNLQREHILPSERAFA